MKVLVDTSVWSLALRRTGSLSEDEAFLVAALSDLLNDLRVVMIGPVRQRLHRLPMLLLPEIAGV